MAGGPVLPIACSVQSSGPFTPCTVKLPAPFDSAPTPQVAVTCVALVTAYWNGPASPLAPAAMDPGVTVQVACCALPPVPPPPLQVLPSPPQTPQASTSARQGRWFCDRHQAGMRVRRSESPV